MSDLYERLQNIASEGNQGTPPAQATESSSAINAPATQNTGSLYERLQRIKEQGTTPAPVTSDRGRGKPSYLRQSMAEGSPVRISDAQAIYATTGYDKDGNALDVESWGAKLKEDAKAAEQKTAELSQKLARLQTSRDSDRLLQEKAPLLHMLFRGRSNGDNSEEIEATKKALEEAQAEQAKIQRAQQYAAQHSAPAKSPNETKLEEARSGGRSYADIFTESGAKVDNLKAMLADYNKRLDDAKRTYGRLWNVTDEGKTASRMVEDITRQLEQEQAYRDYVSGFLTQDEDAGSKQIIRKGEERAKTLKEQFLAENMPDPTSNADYRGWLESNTDKTARDYAEQQYADREPNAMWTQAEKNQYYALMTISPDSAYQFAVDINSAINSEANAAAAERFGNLFSNYDMSKEARAGRSGVMNAVMGLGNMASDVAGIAGGVATGPVKLFNWLDNIYQTNQRGGYYAGNSTPRISDYTDRLLNQNTERLNSYATIRDDMPVLGGKGIGDLYQLVESVAQSMAYGAGLSKAFGVGATTAAGLKAAQQAAKLSTGLIFFGQAADSSYNEYIQRGMSREQAAVGSFFAGLAEAAGEEFSIDHLIDGGISKGLAQYVAKQSFIESTEEGFTNVLNLFGDELAARLTGGESKMRQDIRMLMRNGVGRKDAEREVWKQFVDDTAFDMFGGTLSGGLSAGAYVAPNALYNYTQNRNNRNPQNQQTAKPAQQTQTNAAQGPTTRNPLHEALKPRKEPVAESAAASQTPENAYQTQETPTGEITQPSKQDAAQAVKPGDSRPTETATEQPKTLEERRKDWQRRFDDALARSETADSGDAALSEEFDALDAEDRQLEAEETQAQRVQGGEVSKGFGTPENHIDRRTPESVGNTGVKSFQFDNPQLHGYYVEAAQALKDDVEAAEAVDYERKVNKNTQRKTGSAIKGPVRRLMDLGLTKSQIVKCLQDIIADNGQENYAAAKRVELVLNDMLTNGWQGQRGRNDWHEANADYIAAKDAIDGGVKADSWERYLAQNELSLIDGTVTEEELRAEWEQMHPQEGAAPGPAQPAETASAGTEQSAGTIPASAQTTAERTNGSGPERERGFSANVATDQAMDKPLQESFQDNPDTYRQLTNKETLKKAQDIFNENKEDARNYVVSALAEARNGRKLDPVIVPLARMVANDMSRNGNVDGARSILSDIAVELTAAGQLGQAAKILRDADPNTVLKAIQKALDRINKEAAQKGFSWRAELTAEERSLIDSTDFTQDGAYEKVYKQISKRVGGEMPATVWEKLNEIRRINMLLRPRTQIKNFASNVPMVAVRKLSEAISARIQGALVKTGKLDAAERTRAVASKESKQVANDYFAANKEDILGEGNKWDLNSMLRGDRTIFKDKLLKDTAIGRAVSKMTDKEIESFGEALRQVTYNLLERGDAPFVKSAFVDSLAQFCEAQGITDQSGITQDAIDFATANAMEATFKAANTVAKAVNQLKNNSSPAVSAAIDIILPFTTTPANIMNLMGQYSPIGFANMLGNKSIADKVDAFSKAATGSALMAIGFMLRQAGFITGGEDDDKDKAALDRATGNAVYSIGGRVSYDWIQPVGSLFALGAEISDAVAGHEGFGDAIMNAIYTTGDSALNMSMFQNILSVLKGKGSSTKKIVDAIMEGGLTQLMPGIAGDIAKIIDGTVRSTYTGGNAFQTSIAKAQAATPGASMLLPPSMNVKGEENTRGNLLWRVISQTLFPFNVNIGTKNDVDNEIYRLYDETGSNTHFPNVSPYKVDSDGQSYKMDGDERAKYQETQGQTYYKLAKQAIESKVYKAMTAEQQQLVLHNIATYASSEAKAEFLNAKGQKADSNLSKLYSGVGSPGDSDYVPALDPKNAGEYIAFDTAYKKAVNTGNYAALDSLLSDYGKMNGNAQEVLTANNPGQNDGFGVKRLLEMRDLGISAADYSSVRQAQKDAKKQHNLPSTTSGTAKLFALASCSLSDSQKQKLFESEAYGLSKTVKDLYGILSQYGYDYQDTAMWMYNADYDNKGESNGTLSQVEVIRALERTKDIPNKEAVYQQMKEAFRNEHKINSYYEGSYQSELDYYNRNGWKAGREPTGNLLYDYTR